MNIWEYVLCAVALAMDAFAVSICKGLSSGKTTKSQMLLTGAWFGGFQAAMPLIGFFIGRSFSSYITAVDHWIAFALLCLIGINMIREAFCGEEDGKSASFAFKVMLTMAIATSIDALAIGVNYGFLSAETDVNIWIAVSLIGTITFALSAIGVKFGSFFGEKYQKSAEIFGGAVLILLGTKILFEHLGFINF